MKKTVLLISAFMLAVLFPTGQIDARKIKSSLKKPDKPMQKTEYVKGSQAISTQCEACANGYKISDVVFTGYDKKRSSERESFFITNNTDRELTAVSLYIIYYATDGRQLHKKYVKINCSIPAGETQKTDIRSWDTQKSFYYVKSETNPRKGTPYTVSFDPVTIYLRYK